MQAWAVETSPVVSSEACLLVKRIGGGKAGISQCSSERLPSAAPILLTAGQVPLLHHPGLVPVHSFQYKLKWQVTSLTQNFHIPALAECPTYTTVL